jgi:hypothetical protein
VAEKGSKAVEIQPEIAATVNAAARNDRSIRPRTPHLATRYEGVIWKRTREPGRFRAAQGRRIMIVMAVYIVIVILGGAVSWGIGSATEAISETVSLPVFLGCFFLNFWVSWRIALWLTEPKRRSAAKA